MTTSELAEAQRRYEARIAAILSARDLEIHRGYQQRLQSASPDELRAPPPVSADEERVLALIAHDDQAAALYKQIQVFLRVEKLPQ